MALRARPRACSSLSRPAGTAVVLSLAMARAAPQSRRATLSGDGPNSTYLCQCAS